MIPKVVFGGMEFEGEDAASIVKGTEALAAAIVKVAEAINGVRGELGRIGQKNSIFYADMLRATKMAEMFAMGEITPFYRVSLDDYKNIVAAAVSIRKIETLKAIRAATGIDLAAAKDLVWKYWDTQNAVDKLMKHFEAVG
jgi:ribosomal protein L7/L12